MTTDMGHRVVSILTTLDNLQWPSREDSMTYLLDVSVQYK